MAPFELPEIVLTGVKEKIEALSLQGIGIHLGVPGRLMCVVGDRLYLGTANGNLSVYSAVGPAGISQH
jgi:hypothetical protein